MNIEEAAAVSPNAYDEALIQTYLASDGKDVDHPAGDSLILLYTTGRKSGAVRRVALGSFPDGDSRLVIGSNAGGLTDPQWYLNLLADSRVWVRHRSDFFEASAEPISSEERHVFWDGLTSRVPMFADYLEKAGRELPVIRLTPAAA